MPGLGMGRDFRILLLAEFRRGKVERVRLRIDAHRPGPRSRVDGLDDLELARRGFAGDGQGAVPATGKGIAVELRGVDARANRQIGQDLAVIAAHDDELLRFPATDEEAMMHYVHRHADRAAAGSGGPLVDHLHRLGVHDRDLILVHQIDVGFALGGDEELGLAAQGDRRVRLAGLGINVQRRSGSARQRRRTTTRTLRLAGS